MPAKRMKMIGVKSWQRLVPMARDCSVRSFRNCQGVCVCELSICKIYNLAAAVYAMMKYAR